MPRGNGRGCMPGGDVVGTLQAIVSNLNGPTPDPDGPYAWTCIERSLGQIDKAYDALPAGKAKNAITPDYKVQSLLAAKQFEELLRTETPEALAGADAATVHLIVRDLSVASREEAVAYAKLVVKKAPQSFLGPHAVMVAALNDPGRNDLIKELAPGGDLASMRSAPVLRKFLAAHTNSDIEQIAIAREWLATNPNDPFAMEFEAKGLMRSHQAPETYDLVQKVQKIQPWTCEGLILAQEEVQALYTLRNPAKAKDVAALQAILTTGDATQLPRTTAESLATLTLEAAEKGAARELIDSGLRSFPTSAVLEGDLARLEFGYQYRTKQAVQAAKRAVELDRHDSLYRQYLLSAERQAKDYPAVFAAFQEMRADRVHPTDVSYDDMRDASYYLGRHSEAVDELRKDAGGFGNSSGFHNVYATALKDAGHKQEAIEEFRAALALNADNEASLNVDANLETEGQIDGRWKFLEKFSQDHPTAFYAWQWLVENAGKQSVDAAIAVVRRAQMAVPESYSYFAYEWVLFQNAKKYSEADQAATRGFQKLRAVYSETAPNLYVAAIYNPSWITARGQFDKNLVIPRIAGAHAYLAAGGDAPTAYEQIFYADSVLGRDQEAFDALKKCFNSNREKTDAVSLMFEFENTHEVEDPGRFKTVAQMVAHDPYSIQNLEGAANWNIRWGGSPVLGYLYDAKARELAPSQVGLGLQAAALEALGDSVSSFRAQYQGNSGGIAVSDRYVGWFDAARAQVRQSSNQIEVDAATGTFRIRRPKGALLSFRIDLNSGNPLWVSSGAETLKGEYSANGDSLTRIVSSEGTAFTFLRDNHNRVIEIAEAKGKATRKITIRYDANGSEAQISMHGVGTWLPGDDAESKDQKSQLIEEKIEAFQQQVDGMVAKLEGVVAGRFFGPNDSESGLSEPKATLSVTEHGVRDNGGRVFDLLSDNVHGVTFVARGRSLQVVSHKNPLAGAKPFAQTQTSVLALDRSGRLIANDGSDIVAFEPESSHPKKLFSVLSSGAGGGYPNSLLVARDGSIWCTTPSSAFHFQSGKLDEFSMFKDPERFPAISDMISRVLETAAGKIRVVASNEGHRIYQGKALVGGLLEWDGVKFRRIADAPQQYVERFWTGYTQLAPGLGMVATSGPFYLDKGGEQLTAIYEDPSFVALRSKLNMVWLGTKGAPIRDGNFIFGCGGGLVGWNPKGWFVPEELNDALPDPELADWGGHTVHAVATDDAGRVYAGTDGGLMIYDGPIHPHVLGANDPPHFIEQTKAACSRTVYSLDPSDTQLLKWGSHPTGRLNGPMVWSKTPSGRSYLGPFGQQAVDLRLTGLTKHKNVQVEIELFTIGSWDGDGDRGPGPDIIDIEIPGVGTAMHSTFFGNGQGADENSPFQSFPDPYKMGRHKGFTGAAEVSSLGFPDPRNAVYKLRYTFAHRGENLTLVITGDNVVDAGARVLSDDERWGIGNIVVKTDG